MNIKYPSKQTVRRITSKYSISSLSGGQQRCSCTRQGQEFLHFHLFLFWAPLTVPVVLITARPRITIWSLRTFTFLFSFPCRTRAKPLKCFHGVEILVLNQSMDKTWQEQQDPVTRLALVCLFASPHPQVILEKGREEFELCFPKISVQRCNPEGEQLLQPSENDKSLRDLSNKLLHLRLILSAHGARTTPQRELNFNGEIHSCLKY